jgi:hypothetical protein
MYGYKVPTGIFLDGDVLLRSLNLREMQYDPRIISFFPMYLPSERGKNEDLEETAQQLKVHLLKTCILHL